MQEVYGREIRPYGESGAVLRVGDAFGLVAWLLFSIVERIELGGRER